MRFSVVTLFPEIIEAYGNMSILGRAQEKEVISVKAYNPRNYTPDKWARVDRRPYGGGPGMVLEAPSMLKASDDAMKKAKVTPAKTKIFFLSASGKKFTNEYARTLAKKYKHILFISGRYEGVDARVKKALKAEEISIGDYVLTGGEVASMVMIDAIARQIPGVLGKFESVEEERASASEVYTRPETIVYKKKKMSVPKILLSGHHAKMEAWKEDPKRKTKGKAG
jgi:tRNA (guanine37-N1)-methyltransferase